MAADDRAGAGVPPPSEGEGSELEDIIHDLRIDAADPLARIRHGTYIEDGLILVAEVDRLRARLAAAAPVLAAAREALDIVRRCAADRLEEIGGDIPLGEEGRDLAFGKLEVACGTLSFLTRHADDALTGRQSWWAGDAASLPPAPDGEDAARPAAARPTPGAGT